MYTHFLSHIIAVITGHALAPSPVITVNQQNVFTDNKLNGYTKENSKNSVEKPSEIKVLSKTGSDLKFLNVKIVFFLNFLTFFFN